MSTIEDKVREALVGKTIQSVNVNVVEYHGVASVYITLDDGTVVDFTARERNGGGLLAVYAGDVLVSQ